MRGQDLTGEVLDRRYQIVERLSEGAMGVVYRGVRLKLDRAVAIKVMHASLPDAMEGRKRFEREAKLMAHLEHPHCVSIIDYGLHGEKPYVVMELVRGQSLHDVLAGHGRFETPRAIDIMCQVLSGLAHAHEHGIIHRDIKPANIMITPKAPLGVHARILDFGLARMLGTSASISRGVALGTPSYMAPEQCRGEPADARADVYSCGVMLFEMLTGRKPFVAGDPISIIKKHLDEMPPRLAAVTPDDYGPVEDVVTRALAKSQRDRFPTAIAMAQALDSALAGRATPEPTSLLVVVESSDVKKAEESVDVPITVGSSVTQQAVDSTQQLAADILEELTAQEQARRSDAQLRQPTAKNVKPRAKLEAPTTKVDPRQLEAPTKLGNREAHAVDDSGAKTLEDARKVAAMATALEDAEATKREMEAKKLDDQEAKRQEQKAKREEENAKREELEAKKREKQNAKREELEAKKREKQNAKRELDDKKREEQKAKFEAKEREELEAKKREELNAKRELEARKREELEAKKREELNAKRELEAKKREELNAKREEAEAKEAKAKRELEDKKREEQKAKREEAKRKEAKRKEADARKRKKARARAGSRSRRRYVVIAVLVLFVAGVIGMVVVQLTGDDERAPADVRRDIVATPVDAMPDPVHELIASAEQLVAAGKPDAAIDMLQRGRRRFPDRTELLLFAGKLYFAKLWWNDGIANLREAIRLDPKLKHDPELMKTALRGFLSTPAYDERLAKLIIELGPPMIPLLEAAAREHPKPDVRARSTALLRKLR